MEFLEIPRWYILAEIWWSILGEIIWHIVAEITWYIYVRELTYLVKCDKMIARKSSRKMVKLHNKTEKISTTFGVNSPTNDGPKDYAMIEINV